MLENEPIWIIRRNADILVAMHERPPKWTECLAHAVLPVVKLHISQGVVVSTIFEHLLLLGVHLVKHLGPTFFIKWKTEKAKVKIVLDITLM